MAAGGAPCCVTFAGVSSVSVVRGVPVRSRDVRIRFVTIPPKQRDLVVCVEHEAAAAAELAADRQVDGFVSVPVLPSRTGPALCQLCPAAVGSGEDSGIPGVVSAGPPLG